MEILLNLNQYKMIIDKYSDSINYCADKKNDEENRFWVDLIRLSKERCFYCGELISIDNFEREHRIDKKIFDSNHLKDFGNRYSDLEMQLVPHITSELKRSKYNLIPCCKSCNSKKSILNKELLRNILLKRAKEEYYINNNVFKESNSIILKSVDDVKYFLKENDFLEEKLDIDPITLHLKNNGLKCEQLEIRKKILKSIENIIVTGQYTNSYIDQFLSTLGFNYLKTLYLSENIIFQK